MDMSSEKKFKYTTEVFILVGYLLFFCLAFILFYFFLMSIFLKRPIPPINTFATSLPATTPIPHMSSAVQLEGNRIFEDDFSSDKYNWTNNNSKFREDVSDGRLLFESKLQNSYAIAKCGLCPYLKEPYYIQADFSTTTVTDGSFGIVFNFSRNDNSFFLFLINTESKKYYIYHQAAYNWSLRASGESEQIAPFPAINNLGVYAGSDTAEFYINEKFVDSITESKYPFQFGYFSFYVDNYDFKLVVDNLVLTK